MLWRGGGKCEREEGIFVQVLPRPTKLTIKYLWSVTFRLAVFLLVAVLFLWKTEWLDFTAGKPVPV